jgi:DNA-binding beta-propeller fold protein YncE
MAIVTTGSNTTGRRGVVAVDKVANKIRFLDPGSLVEIASIDGPSPCVHELAVSPDHDWAAVPLYGDGIYGGNKTPGQAILVLDLAARRIARSISISPYVAPHGMVATSTRELWVVCDIPRKLLRIEMDAGTIAAAYDCPTHGPHILVCNAGGSRLYVSAKEGDIAVFDVAAQRFEATLPVRTLGIERGNGSGSEGITLTPDGTRLIAIDNDRGDLRVFDTTSHKEVARHAKLGQPLTNSKRSRLGKLMFSPDGRHLVVTDYASGSCWVIDSADFARQSLVPVAKGPMGLAFPPEGGSVIVSSHDSGLLTRIDLTTAKPIASYDGGSGIEVLCYF